MVVKHDELWTSENSKSVEAGEVGGDAFPRAHMTSRARDASRSQHRRHANIVTIHVSACVKAELEIISLLLVYIKFRTSTSAAVLSLQQSRNRLQLDVASPLVNGTNL